MESLIRQFYEVPGKVITLQKGQYLFHEGDGGRYFYLVRKGPILITKYASTGRELALRLAKSGSVIGELPLFEEKPIYLFNAIAQGDCEVYAIEYHVLESFLEKKPNLTVALLKVLSKHMRKQHSKFRDLILYGKKGAVYSTLIRLANSYGQETEEGVLLSVPLTNQELANYSAMARESLNRIFNDLKKMGIVDYRKGCILIKNLSFLKEEIACEGCAKEICNIE